MKCVLRTKTVSTQTPLRIYQQSAADGGRLEDFILSPNAISYNIINRKEGELCAELASLVRVLFANVVTKGL